MFTTHVRCSSNWLWELPLEARGRIDKPLFRTLLGHPTPAAAGQAGQGRRGVVSGAPARRAGLKRSGAHGHIAGAPANRAGEGFYGPAPLTVSAAPVQRRHLHYSSPAADAARGEPGHDPKGILPLTAAERTGNFHRFSSQTISCHLFARLRPSWCHCLTVPTDGQIQPFFLLGRLASSLGGPAAA